MSQREFSYPRQKRDTMGYKNDPVKCDVKYW